MTGLELMDSLEVVDKSHMDQQELFNTILGLLSYEKIAING